MWRLCLQVAVLVLTLLHVPILAARWYFLRASEGHDEATPSLVPIAFPRTRPARVSSAADAMYIAEQAASYITHHCNIQRTTRSRRRLNRCASRCSGWKRGAWLTKLPSESKRERKPRVPGPY